MFFYANIFNFWENLNFWVKNAFFTISESEIRKKSKILLKDFSKG